MRGPACPGNDGESYQTPLEVIVTYCLFIINRDIRLYSNLLTLQPLRLPVMDYFTVMFCFQEFIFQGVIPHAYGRKACFCDGRRSA